MKSIHDTIQSYMDQQVALGAAIALLKDGEIVYLGGFGKTHVEAHGAKVTAHTLFYYGSICKTICAMLIMRLVEAGLLALDRPVVEYLPDLRFSRADYGSRVTLRHLLSHTSGLPMGGKYWGSRDPDSLRRFVYEQIPHYTFLSEPGVVHLYSNTVFCVAGHIAEVVTGKFYDDLVQEYVFDPLQMKRSTYDPVVAMTQSVAIRHEADEAGNPQPMRKLPYNVSGNPASFAYGSVEDLANLAKMVLNQGRFGEQTFLTPATIAEMQRAHSDRRLTGTASGWIHVYGGYGLGFEVGHYDGHHAARHGGGMLCYFDLFPDDKAGVILLTNFQNERLVMHLLTELYEYVLEMPQRGVFSLERPAPYATPLTAEQLQRCCGSYLNVETANLMTFVTADGNLLLDQPGETKPLVRIGESQFYVKFAENRRLPIAFIQDSSQNVTHALIGGEPYHPIAIDPAVQPDLSLWQSFVGMYKDPSNTNRDEIFTVRLQEGELFIAEGDNEAPCRAIRNRCFLSDLGLFEFADTAVAGVRLLIWGKAVCFYPIDVQKYRAKGVITYLAEIPEA